MDGLTDRQMGGGGALLYLPSRASGAAGDKKYWYIDCPTNSLIYLITIFAAYIHEHGHVYGSKHTTQQYEFKYIT